MSHVPASSANNKDLETFSVSLACISTESKLSHDIKCSLQLPISQSLFVCGRRRTGRDVIIRKAAVAVDPCCFRPYVLKQCGILELQQLTAFLWAMSQPAALTEPPPFTAEVNCVLNRAL